MMKKIFFGLCITLGMHVAMAQISYSGCEGTIPAGYPFTLDPVDTTDDGGVIRNTFMSALPGPSCGAGVCAFRIMWNTTEDRWEIALSNDGGNSFPPNQILYYNEEASEPNPPSMNLGVWIDNLGGACGGNGSISILTGDVQDQVLSVADNDWIRNGVSLYPNPSYGAISVASTEETIQQVSVYNLLGKQVLQQTSSFEVIDVSAFASSIYLVKIKLDNGAVLHKRLVKK